MLSWWTMSKNYNWNILEALVQYARIFSDLFVDWKCVQRISVYFVDLLYNLQCKLNYLLLILNKKITAKYRFSSLFWLHQMYITQPVQAYFIKFWQKWTWSRTDVIMQTQEEQVLILHLISSKIWTARESNFGNLGFVRPSTILEEIKCFVPSGNKSSTLHFLQEILSTNKRKADLFNKQCISILNTLNL